METAEEEVKPGQGHSGYSSARSIESGTLTAPLPDDLGKPMTITFARPPINEVVLGIGFLPRQDLLVPHFGRFWNLIREQYPNVAHAPPVAAAGVLPLQDASGAWLPRVWFIGADDSRLVQLQQDQLYVNWRQTEESKPYPRFPAIREEFHRVWEVFSRFLDEETGTAPQPIRMELSYINIVPHGEGWTSAADFGGVLRDYGWQARERYLPGPSRFAGNFEFDVGGGMLLVSRIGMGRRLADNKEVLRLELLAKSAIGADLDIASCVARAHDVIVNAFKDLTTEAMQREPWQLQAT